MLSGSCTVPHSTWRLASMWTSQCLLLLPELRWNTGVSWEIGCTELIGKVIELLYELTQKLWENILRLFIDSFPASRVSIANPQIVIFLQLCFNYWKETGHWENKPYSLATKSLMHIRTYLKIDNTKTKLPAFIVVAVPCVFFHLSQARCSLILLYLLIILG